MKRRLIGPLTFFILLGAASCLASGVPGCAKNGTDKPAAPVPAVAPPMEEPPMSPAPPPAPPVVEAPPVKPPESDLNVATPAMAVEPPEKLTDDAERACRTDADCTFEPDHPCFCPSCEPALRKAINRKTAQERLDFYARAKFDCYCPAPRCEQKWIGRAVACRKGLCTTLR